VRKILFFLAPMVLLAIVYGCGKDHVAPTFSKYDSLMKQPTGFVAVYDSIAKEFKMVWSMPDTLSVRTYNVAWSDSNVFDLGHVQNKNTQSLLTDFKISESEVMKTMGYTIKPYPHYLYFTVSAVYSNNVFKEFIGPRAVIDSAVVHDWAK